MSSSRNAAAAEMQSLMARLQGRLAGGNAQRERFTTLANQIRSGDESDKYTALTEVCEALNMATEEILMGMRPDVLVPPTVQCLRLEHNNELMYLAARVLTYMADTIPPTAQMIVRCDGVPLLCEKLMAISDIELAEQCISCLDRVANDNPAAVLDAGGAVALLTFVDFFSTAVQRNAVATVAKICRQVRTGTFGLVSSILPQLRNFVQSDDEKIAEQSLLALSRIANGVRQDANMSVEVFGETAPIIMDVLEGAKSGARFSAAVKFLVAVASVAAVAEMLVDLGSVKTLTDVLSQGGCEGGAPSPADRIATAGAESPLMLAASPSASRTPTRMTPIMSPAASPATPPPPLTPQQQPKKAAKLSPDVVADLTAVLKLLLPPPQEDFTLYMDGVELIQHHSGSLGSRRQSSVLSEGNEEAAGEGEDDEGDEDDGDEEAHEPEPEPAAAAATDPRAAAATQRRLAQRQLIENHLQARGIQIQNERRWLGLRVGRHQCDSCGKAGLAPGDWYRCNDVEDSDLCQHCLCVPSGAASGTSYTDMGALLEANRPGEGTDEIVERKPQLTEKHAMLQRSPHLLERIAEAAPTLVSIALEVDHPAARRNSIEFMMRVVAQANADVAGELLDIPSIGSFVSSLLRRGTASRLQEVAAAVFISERLARLRPDKCREVFIKEGVLHALSAARSVGRSESKAASPVSSSGPGALPLAHEQPLHLRTSTEAGWRRLLAERTTALVAMLSGGEDRPAARALAAAAAAVDEDDAPVAGDNAWATAVDNLCSALETGASAFELLNSGVIEGLVHYLAKAPSADARVAAAVTLLAGLSAGRESPVNDSMTYEPASPGRGPEWGRTTLARLLKHLHTLIGQLENFSATQNHRAIRLQIQSQRGASEPQSPTSPNRPAALPVPDRRSGAASSPSNRRRDRAVNVSIEPLATIAAVSDFICQRILNMAPPGLGGPGTVPQRQRGEQPAGPEDDEDVEDILPETSASVKARAAEPAGRASGVRTPSSPTVGPTIYVRYGDQTLAHSMSMQQVMQEYVPRSKHGEPVNLYFSLTPFGPEVKPVPTSGARDHTYAPQFCSNTLFRCAAEIEEAVVGRLGIEECATAEVVEPLVAVLRLLRVLHSTLRNPESIRDWYAAVGAMQFPETEYAAPAVVQFAQGHATTVATEFQNSKLTNKALRCVDGPNCITVLLESWCVALACDCPFLFSTAVRRLLFEVAFFGTSRALVRVMEHCKEMEIPVSAHHKNHRVARHKFRVWRDRPLECARVIFEQHGASRSMFDIQYYNEVGSGLGPTHEFFHLVGDALRSKSLGVWRSGDENPTAKVIETTVGLFLQPDGSLSGLDPDSVPMAKSASFAGLSGAGFVGSFLARGLIDHHVVNVRLSPAQLRLLRGDRMVMEDLRHVSPDIYDVLRALTIAHNRGATVADVGSAKNVPIADLGLQFVVPGADVDLPLKPGGEGIAVTPANVAEYVGLVGSVMLCEGVHTPAVEMREAFNRVLSLRGLRLFMPSELGDLFCGHQTVVTAEEWAAHTLCDHGFTSASPTVRTLYEVLGDMTLEEQQLFIRFLTGSKQLPVGGLPALRPKVTVVRKRLADGGLAQEVQQLPSAMTCQNYLKLPAYDTREALESKLKQAIQEGSSAFSFT
jgi:E3 ubiquitin-protein ligase TRIP12